MMTIAFVSAAAGLPAAAQDVYQQPTVTGTVTASNKKFLTVKTEDGKYRVFIFDHNTTQPQNIPVGSVVKVTWVPTDDPNVRLADTITIVPPGGEPQQDNVPAEVRNVERAIEKDFRRFRLGFQGGIALDPETILIGGHMQLGPLFSRNLFFRPSIDYGWGDVTRLVAVNADVVYNVPFGPRTLRWFYVGGGPGFNFVKRDFAVPSGNPGNNVNLSEFNYDATLNILAGIKYRAGWWAEFRSSVYASRAPVVHLVVGYTF